MPDNTDMTTTFFRRMCETSGVLEPNGAENGQSRARR